jgi:pimeloyl-ACP methyl ester carboxylesterase
MADILLFILARTVDTFWTMAAFIGFIWLTLSMLLQRLNDHLKSTDIKAWLKQLIKAITGIIEVVALLSALLLCLQDVMLYHPNSDPGSQQYLLSRPGFSEVSFASEGRVYNGMMKSSDEPEPSPLIIMFVGNGQNAAQTMRALDSAGMWESFLGYDCLIMDYPGYGKNSGRPSAKSIYSEALLTYDYAANLPYVDESRIIVGGFSLGTAPAVYLAAQRDVEGLFLLAPYESAYDLYNSVLPIFHGPLRLLVKHKFLSGQYAPSITAPVLIVASESDEAVAFSSSVRLKERFTKEPEFVALTGIMHNGILFNKQTRGSIKDYLAAIQ